MPMSLAKEKSSSIQVSFIVNGTCNIEISQNNPNVKCLNNSQHLIEKKDNLYLIYF